MNSRTPVDKLMPSGIDRLTRPPEVGPRHYSEEITPEDEDGIPDGVSTGGISHRHAEDQLGVVPPIRSKRTGTSIAVVVGVEKAVDC